MLPGGPAFTVHGTRASYLKPGSDTQEASLIRRVLPGDPGFGHDPLEGEIFVPHDERVESRAVANEKGDYPAFYRGVRDAILDAALARNGIAWKT